MKLYLNQIKNKILGFAEHAVLGIICLHEMGLPPAEADTIFHMVHPGQEEARQMASIARQKYHERQGETVIKKAGGLP